MHVGWAFINLNCQFVGHSVCGNVRLVDILLGWHSVRGNARWLGIHSGEMHAGWALCRGYAHLVDTPFGFVFSQVKCPLVGHSLGVTARWFGHSVGLTARWVDIPLGLYLIGGTAR